MLASGVVVGWPSPARADTREVRARLSYEVMPGAEACRGERSVHEQVALRLGYDPFHDDAEEHVKVRLSPRPGGLRAVITTEQPGEAPALRELDSDGAGCDELLQSVVLTVSLAIDPTSLTRAPPTPEPPSLPVTPPEAEVRLEPSPAPVPPSAPRSEGAAPPRNPWNVELSAAVRAGYALLPGGGSVGPLVDLRVGKGGWALLAEAGADLPTGSANNPNGKGSVTASLLRGGLGACAVRAWFIACAQLDAGELEGTGQGSATVTGLTGSSVFLDAAAAAGVDLTITSALRLEILADLVVPITRTTLGFGVLNGMEVPAWRSPELAGLLTAGMGYRFF
jgi:hypothetical protein